MKKKAKKDDNYRKLTIPKAIREQCWIETMGRNFESKCYIPWCKNIINVFRTPFSGCTIIYLVIGPRI